MASQYGTLGVLVEAITRPMEQQISRAATRAGDDAATKVSGRMSKGLARLAPVAGSIGKSVASGLGIASAAAVAFGVHAFKAASQVEAMRLTLDALAKANGVSATKVQETVGAVQRLGIEAGQAQSFVGTLVRGHIDLAHATDLARISQNLAASTGKDLGTVQQGLTRAILSGNAGALKRVGIVVDSTTAEKKLAAQLGVSVSNLTQAQKSQATLNAVMAAGKTVAGAYGAQLKTPQGALRLLRVDLANITEEIGGPLVKALTPAFAGLAKLGASFAGAVAPGGKLEPIIKAIGTVAVRTVGPVTHLMSSLAAGFNKISPATVQKIANAITKFGPALLGVGAAAGVLTGAGLLGNLPVIGGMLEHLLGPVDLLKGGLLDLGKGMLTTLIPGLKGVVGEVGGLGKVLGAATGPVGIILTIFATLMAVSPQFRQAVMGLVQALITALMPAFKAILVALKPLLPIIVLLARQLGGLLAPVIKALTPLLVSLTPMITELAVVVGMLLKLVLMLVLPVLKVYMAFQKWYFMKVLIPVINLLVGALTWLVRIITSVVKWILGGSPGLVPAFQLLQKVVTTVTSVIRNVVITGFTAIRNAIQAAWRFITTTSVSTWNAVRSVVTNAIHAVVAVVGSGIATVRGLISRGLSAALGIVRQWGTSLLALGRSAIGNLLNGIAGAMRGIGGFIKAHVVDPVVNAVKSFFGIHSPSEVMASLGESVGKGFIAGLVRQNPLTVAKHIFGGLPNALGALVTKGLVSIAHLPGKALAALGKVGGFLRGALSKIGGLFGGGGNVTEWLAKALLATGSPMSWLGAMQLLVSRESGGNPRAFNPTSVLGQHASGLLQTLPSTFAAYSLGGSIWNPIANAIAALRYIRAVYGSPFNIRGLFGGRYVGYALGGPITEPITGFGHQSGQMYQFGERGPEWVSPLTGPAAQIPGRDGAPVVINVYPQKGQSEVEIAAAVSRRLAWAAATGRA
jgi:phage-related protein